MTNLKLDDHVVALIQERVSSGGYADASAVVREGLRLLEVREKRSRLDNLLAEARAEYGREGSIAYSATLLDEIEREVEDNERVGIEIDLDPNVVG